MRAPFHVRFVFKNGVSIQMVYVVCASAVGRCALSFQDDMSKARSVSKDWAFVSKGTEISLGTFVLEHFTPLTLDVQTGVVSDQDTVEIWETMKKETIEKVRGNKNRSGRADSPKTDEKEVEKSF